ncbi:hypothetical protein G5C60_04750 [Streptomyces sp. HC44]|uniref:Protein-glutamine gamma-glutamyltransferase TgpA N-terminal domain-containing protein n=1 Tax=Streptomyces scabichelini TaxID=2711217 RepID=A0A6G4UZ09_9ACTN|nr:transglutaminaseTgpA domain-containing protein [Streptomyces scabichelini]NGO06981.1 hypothetical protein [Streptomyces scabichelini]
MNDLHRCRLALPALMVAAAAAGAAFHGVFGYGPLLLPVAVAAAVPVTLSYLLRRASLEVTCVVSAVLWLMTSSLTLRMGEPVVVGLTGTLEGEVNGWARLLSVSIPAPVRPDLLTVGIPAGKPTTLARTCTPPVSPRRRPISWRSWPAWRRQSPTPSLFEASEPARWRVGVLTLFDGVRWSSDAVFRVGGPTITMPAPDGSPLREDVRILDLTGQLLPVAEQPARLVGDGLAADATAGLALHAQGLEQGYRYGLDAVRTRVRTPAQQSAQRVSRDDPQLTKLPLGIPASLRDFAESTH